MKLALEHHYSPVIAEQLRARGHDVVAAIEVGWHLMPDADLLAACATERRALLTNNVADFVFLTRDLTAQGRQHWGLIFTSDAGLPRSKATIGIYVTKLEALLTRHDSDIADQVIWL